MFKYLLNLAIDLVKTPYTAAKEFVTDVWGAVQGLWSGLILMGSSAIGKTEEPIIGFLLGLASIAKTALIALLFVAFPKLAIAVYLISAFFEVRDERVASEAGDTVASATAEELRKSSEQPTTDENFTEASNFDRQEEKVQSEPVEIVVEALSKNAEVTGEPKGAMLEAFERAAARQSDTLESLATDVGVA